MPVLPRPAGTWRASDLSCARLTGGTPNPVGTLYRPPKAPTDHPEIFLSV